MSEYTQAQLISYLMVSFVTGYTAGLLLKWARQLTEGFTRD